MVRTSLLQPKGQVTIPKEARDELKLRPGDEVIWVRADDGTWEIWSAEALEAEFDRASEGLAEWARRAKKGFHAKRATR